MNNFENKKEICELCSNLTQIKNDQKINLVLSCTTDSNNLHHSYNDQPAIIYKSGMKIWLKNNMPHRENGPCTIYTTNSKYEWFFNGVNIYKTKHKPKNNSIQISKDKVAIILKHMFEYEENVYFCLIDHEKIYVRCAA